MLVLEPPLVLSAQTFRGLSTVIFPSKPYRRVIKTLWINSVAGGTATVYRGDPQGQAVITSTNKSNPNTFTTPINLPAGQGLYVVFSTATSPVNAAQARMESMREE